MTTTQNLLELISQGQQEVLKEHNKQLNECINNMEQLVELLTLIEENLSVQRNLAGSYHKRLTLLENTVIKLLSEGRNEKQDTNLG